MLLFWNCQDKVSFQPDLGGNLNLSIRVCTIRTSDEVLVLVLGVEPEPSLKVVLKQLGSSRLVWVRNKRTNRTRAIIVQPGSGSVFGSAWPSTFTSVLPKPSYQNWVVFSTTSRLVLFLTTSLSKLKTEPKQNLKQSKSVYLKGSGSALEPEPEPHQRFW